MKKKEYKKRLAKEKSDRKKIEENISSKEGINKSLKIFFSILIFIGLMFTFTKIITGEWDLFTKNNKAEKEFSGILCSKILSQEESEYYVLFYDKEADESIIIDTLIERYNNLTNHQSVYVVDTKNGFNKPCVTEEDMNISNDLSNLKIKDPTLLKIVNKNIMEFYYSKDKIKEHLLDLIDSE